MDLFDYNDHITLSFIIKTSDSCCKSQCMRGNVFFEKKQVVVLYGLKQPDNIFLDKSHKGRSLSVIKKST